MSFGFSAGDFLAASTLAWKMWQACKDSESNLEDLAADVAALHLILKELSEQTDVDLSNRQDETQQILEGTRRTLNDIKALIAKYEKMGVSTVRRFKAVRFGFEDIAGIKRDLTLQTSILSAFNTSCQK